MNGIRVSILLLLLSVCGAETLSVVRGNLESDSPLMGNNLYVELQDDGHAGARMQTHVGGDGSFVFRGVSSGRYTLRVTTFNGDTICDQFVDLSQAVPLTIRLPEDRRARPVSGLVSVQQLQRRIPDKAVHAFTDAMRQSEKKRTLEAIRKLDEALRLFPDYFEARCNLGVQYVRLGRNEEAREQFEKAAAIGPASAVVYGNLAYLHFAAGRLQDAKEAARRALALDSKLPLAHYLLGTILAAEEKDFEAIGHLQLGAQVSPKAHMQAARIYQKAGDTKSAARELRLYLNSGDAIYRADAERWLAALARN